MKCPRCHTEIPADTRFCSSCGAPLHPSEEISISHTKTLETPTEKLTRGSTFASRYEVIEELGKGGMGKVYRVFDKKIEEEVALKLLKPEIAADKKTIERFRNELKFARKIGHRNVCKMYDLNEEEGTHYITMEYVPGEDLKSFIRRAGQLTTGKSIFIAKQVCEGLAEAHGLGVVHRDLKPGNIMIDKEGNARIMDFGIARSLKTKGITAEGVMIGTPEYMSPEQAEAKEVDKRSDIYSLGVILYEMVTGRVPFEGETPLSVAMKHKSEDPKNPREINAQIPEDLSRAILKCMEKAKEKRYQTTEELLSELSNIEKGIPTTERIIPKRKPITAREITVTFGLKKLLVPGLVFLTLAVVIVLSVFLIKRLPLKKPILPAHKQITFTGNASYPAISPDGKFIAYSDYEPSGEEKVIVQDVAGGQSLEVFAGKGCRRLQWLPDGSELSFVAFKKDVLTEEIFIVPRLGGTARQLDALPTYAWSPDGVQLANTYANRKKILLTNKSTGESKSIALKGSFTWLTDVDWSSLGNLVLFLTLDEKQGHAIWTATIDGSQQYKVIEDSVPLFSPRWSPQGDAIFYLRGREQAKELWKIPVESNTGKPAKSPWLVLAGMQAGNYFTITSNGKQLFYTRELNYSNLWLAKVEGSGKNRTVNTKKLTTGTLISERPSISPDGNFIAFSRGDGNTANIFVMPIEGGSPQQITFLNSYNTNPVWSPDGKEIAFGSKEGGAAKVWKVSVHGGKPYQFAESKLSLSYSLIWSPGPNILYQRQGNRNFHILNPPSGEEIPSVEDDSVGWIFYPQYSPDGKSIAVHWNRRPSRGIWIISLEDSSQVSIKEGSAVPIGWSTDGKWVHAFERKSEKYLKIELGTGQVKTLPTMSFALEGRSRIKLLDGKPDIFLDWKTHSDIWVVENFDPELK